MTAKRTTSTKNSLTINEEDESEKDDDDDDADVDYGYEEYDEIIVDSDNDDDDDDVVDYGYEEYDEISVDSDNDDVETDAALNSRTISQRRFAISLGTTTTSTMDDITKAKEFWTTTNLASTNETTDTKN